MIRPPFAARVVTGLIVTAIEETRKLPHTAVTLPMTAVSEALQVAMRLQQGIAELAIKGDQTLELIFHRPEEQPEWAVFDEDDDLYEEDDDVPAAPKVASPPAAAAAPATTTAVAAAAPTPDLDDDDPEARPLSEAATAAAKGRFALYSSAPETVLRSEVEASPSAPAPDAPEIVEYLDYDALTLAQLRAKIRTVELADLEALAEYERTHRGRAPFQTMLENRITAASSK
ncbi:lipid droplet-associated protein [Williamsia sp. CHRR-6]|uniref:lipid droplet-associated protein n=1 Tax=Williamsia sp. CHRR-6 TaxID=2835871 RepID=UPI001BDAA754|nr:lipid droplet-associated protein [Williamsia sp. CHRR-6]MBT0566736.1 lipid droplet-associated protein [Williamsia sp. CHRR-6]